MKSLIYSVLSLFILLNFQEIVIANDKIISKIIIDGGWGNTAGQFGRDYSGKTEDEYELSLLVSNNERPLAVSSG